MENQNKGLKFIVCFDDKAEQKAPLTLENPAEDYLKELNQKGWGIFETANSFFATPEQLKDLAIKKIKTSVTKRNKEFLTKLNEVFADLDVCKDTDDITAEEREKCKIDLKKALDDYCQPSSYVITKNGLQPRWQLDEPNIDEAAQQQYVNVINGIIEWSKQNGAKGDPVKDVTRVLRKPGYFHQKSDPYLITEEKGSGKTYTLEELKKYFWHEPVVKTSRPADVGNEQTYNQIDALDIRQVVIDVWKEKGSEASFDGDNHLIIDGTMTATFVGRQGDGNYMATTSSDYPAKGNAVTYVAETLGITTKEAYKWLCEKYLTNDLQENGRSSQANTLLEAIFSRKDIVLFHNGQGDGYISLNISEHRESWPCGGKRTKKWLSSEIYRLQKKASGAEVIKSILAVLEGRACFEGLEIELQNRAAWLNGELWYDLTNRDWQAVRINKDGWEIVNKPPILFNRYSHHKAQTEPARGGNAKLFLKYVNIANPKHKLLDLVSMISDFIPGFPHVMTVIFGPQGSTKTTHSKIKRAIVDPSLIDVTSFPHSQRELVQALAHHYFLFFDNVTYITEDQSDTLCRAITGGGHIKRELYTDDEDVIYNFKRCIGLNGINLITTRPDLLERSLLLELERIEPKNRRTEKELYNSFEKDLPFILGGIFDTLVKAINIFPTINLKSHHRMADWEIWGCAIAEALGYTKEEFLAAYQDNITRQTEMLLNENIVATAVITFMQDKEVWKGTPTELLRQLTVDASFAEIDTREKYWPKGANILSRRLNELSTPLKQMGISVVISTSGTERYIHIQKIPKDMATQDGSNNKSDGADDKDDKNTTLTEPISPEVIPF